MLLDNYKNYHTGTLFIFRIFVSLSSPRSIYVVSTAHKIEFSIKDFFSTCDQSIVTADLVKFTEEILNGKLQFLCSDRCGIFFFFIFIFLIINQIISLKQMQLFLAHFLEYALLFLDDNEDKESEWFANSKKSSLRVLRIFSLIFCQLQPDVAYKSVAQKKSVHLF